MAAPVSRPPSSRPGASAPAPAPGPEWPGQAADTIVNVVGQVRDKTTGPILTAARGIVFGMFIAIIGTVAMVLFCIMAIRLLNEYVFTENVWAAYLSLGALFCVAAAWLWSKAVGQPAE